MEAKQVYERWDYRMIRKETQYIVTKNEFDKNSCKVSFFIVDDFCPDYDQVTFTIDGREFLDKVDSFRLREINEFIVTVYDTKIKYYMLNYGASPNQFSNYANNERLIYSTHVDSADSHVYVNYYENNEFFNLYVKFDKNFIYKLINFLKFSSNEREYYKFIMNILSISKKSGS